MFPLNRVFKCHAWLYPWARYWRNRGEDVHNLQDEFHQSILTLIERYEVPLIRLDKANGREAICLTFEKVNVGNKKLDAFELLTAIYAADNFDLRCDWFGPPDKPDYGRRGRVVRQPNGNIRDALFSVASTEFLQACTLPYTREHRLERAASGTAARIFRKSVASAMRYWHFPSQHTRRTRTQSSPGLCGPAHFLTSKELFGARIFRIHR